MRFKLGVGFAGLLIAAVSLAGLVIVTVRGESTRETVDRISVCARAAAPNPAAVDVADCARLRRRMDEIRSLGDACIVQRKTLKAEWFEVVTRCPTRAP